MTCIYCEDDPEVSKNCYCREVARPLNVTAEEVRRKVRELDVIRICGPSDVAMVATGKTIALKSIVSVLEIDGKVVVKSFEPLENCTVTIHDIDLHVQQLDRASSGLTIDCEALGEALKSALLRHSEEPEHGGKRKNHPQPCNPKSFRKNLK